MEAGRESRRREGKKMWEWVVMFFFLSGCPSTVVDVGRERKRERMKMRKMRVRVCVKG